eukprot:GILK01013341.1.p1 GENE.GILK01013341.1~~GILK01013341.1.p1  ORF type:complete len:852 (-),score=148.87 GILK01013341.1:45-2600(-)
MSHIIGNRLDVHHKIWRRLSSTYRPEVDAAINAIECVCTESKAFAESILDKLYGIIKDLGTPLAVKLQLIRVLRHMHHEPTLTIKARDIAESTLKSYPAAKFVAVILDSLTELTLQANHNLPNQIQLLVQYATTDIRGSIQYIALSRLHKLLKSNYHQSEIDPSHFFNLIGSSSDPKIRYLSLTCLYDLIQSSRFSSQIVQNKANLSLLESLLCCTDLNLRVLSLKLFIRVVKMSGTDIPEISIQYSDQLLLLFNQDVHGDTAFVRYLVNALSSFCRIDSASKSTFIQLLVREIVSPDIRDSTRTTLCHCLALITDSQSYALAMYVESLLPWMESVTDAEVAPLLAVMNLSIAFFKSHMGSFEDQFTIERQLVTFVERCITSPKSPNSNWLFYIWMRESLVHGYFKVTERLAATLKQQVESDHFYSWINSLQQLSTPSPFMHSTDVMDVSTDTVHQPWLAFVDVSIETLLKCLVSLRGASSSEYSFSFQQKFVNLRLKFLQILKQLIAALSSSLVTSLASSGDNRSDLHVVATRLKDSVKASRLALESLTRSYQHLKRLSISIDSESESVLELWFRVCQLIGHLLHDVILHDSIHDGSATESACLNGDAMAVDEPANETVDETAAELLDDDLINTLIGGDSQVTSSKSSLASVYNAIQLSVQQFKASSEARSLPLHHRVGFVKDAMQSLCSVPWAIPRFFFVTKPCTRVNLSYSLNQETVNFKSVTLRLGSALSIQIAGHIAPLSNKVAKRIESVHLMICFLSDSKSRIKPELDHDLNPDSVFAQSEHLLYSVPLTVPPKHGAISTECILRCPSVGDFEVSIQPSIRDTRGNIWNGGDPIRFAVKVQDKSR